jgi:GGDEF domain-containing protein
MEDAMLESLAQVALEALAALPVGVFLVDEDDRIRQANPAAHALLGAQAGELEGMAFVALTGGQPLPADAVRLTLSGIGESAAPRIECQLRELSPDCLPLVRVVCLVDPADVDPRRGLRPPPVAEMDASRLDADTGLLNRRNILQELNAQVSRSRRYGNVLSVLYLQLPAMPVEVRRAFAQAVKGTLRWVDIVGRWDDDALLVVLPETSRDAASVLAHKLLEVVQESFAELERPRVGAAQWVRGEESTDLVSRAAAQLRELAQAG